MKIWNMEVVKFLSQIVFFLLLKLLCSFYCNTDLHFSYQHQESESGQVRVRQDHLDRWLYDTLFIIRLRHIPYKYF